MPDIRVLASSDRPALAAFLARHIDSSLFLLSNLDRAGIEDHGEPLQGTYVASLHGGELTAVAAHFWNGIVIVQGDAGLEHAAMAAVAHTGRPLTGLIGPLPQVQRARRALGADSRRHKKGDPETLFALDLHRLRVPALLDDPSVTCRRLRQEDLDFLLDWRVDYEVEALGEDRTPDLREKTREHLRVSQPGWVLFHHGRPVSYSTFNATTHGVVQVGGVFTPRELRARGYARAVVASSLLDARRDGQRRSVLFTSRGNVAAKRAYEAIGYEPIGEFGLLLFAEG